MVKQYPIQSDKKNEVRAMFNNIARSYDFLNHFLSFGIDVLWRKRLIREITSYSPEVLLDMATGTGDLAIMGIKTGAQKIVGIDLASEMIAVGKQKVIKKNLEERIELLVGDAEQINFDSNTFDAAMVAFGVRNFENLEKGLTEIGRVLKNDQPLFVLEFSKPKVFPIKQLYHFYSFTLIPLIGQLISKDKNAYHYLPESIKAFPHGKSFIHVFEKCGFVNCSYISLSFGIATIYIGHKQAIV
ncbi:MAG TPA: bifunctional demethylmenaquinone methyltransferase/2-methoxy-6-polyprenyl-1,4-benzoquinol methylase UbiE [Prolixibacteraceae bacterium]|nr:bifunctional demethylmenaquinone methyltransferase/2-methoxy-6-polyprenyl-1,4-benzoquinol methylase UbiE [Prolixibacteraceae bacterium]